MISATSDISASAVTAGVGHNTGQPRRTVHAIAFDLDTEALKTAYHNPSWQNAYNDIGKVLTTKGFLRQQGSVYFGNERVDPVTCVLAVMELSRRFSWFSVCVRDIRMLRIEDNNDLMPAVMQAVESS
ncbi:virulence factor [Tistrella mobilis]|uniref:virulence factor n=1 Tax=Tistrella mobilis TaxID=171437 RepID=UPI003555C5C7